MNLKIKTEEIFSVINKRYSSVPNQDREVRNESKCLKKCHFLFDSDFEAIQQKFGKLSEQN